MSICSNSGVQLTVRQSLEYDYQVIFAENAREALSALKVGNKDPDIILLQIALSGMNGFELYSNMIRVPKLKNVPFIFIAEKGDIKSEVESYSIGGSDCLMIPVDKDLLQRRIEKQLQIVENKRKLTQVTNRLSSLEVERITELLSAEKFLTEVITDLMSKKDVYSGLHSIRVSKLFQILLEDMVFGDKIKIPEEDMDQIVLAAQLHDIGKIGVPDAILVKEGKYTQQEFDIMKQHTVFGADAIKKFSYLLSGSRFADYILKMARSHHEQWCGKGYPDGLAGKQIPHLARILNVCDIYDGLVSKRSYKQSISHQQAVMIINQISGVQCDPDVVASFNEVCGEFQKVYNQAQ